MQNSTFYRKLELKCTGVGDRVNTNNEKVLIFELLKYAGMEVPNVYIDREFKASIRQNS